MARTVERMLRLPLPAGQGDPRRRLITLVLRSDDETSLDVIDCVLGLNSRSLLRRSFNAELERLLQESGSAWKVATDAADVDCLQRRLDASATQAAGVAMAAGDNAARHLHVAWSAVYGRDPNPSHGYHEAVRAVEAAAAPIVTPDDRRASLGKMIAAMADAPQKWAMRFTEPGVAPVLVVIEMMRLLWVSQFDRHGRSDEGALHVTQDEAEDAIQLAVVLVQWFRNGAITRL